MELLIVTGCYTNVIALESVHKKLQSPIWPNSVNLLLRNLGGLI